MENDGSPWNPYTFFHHFSSSLPFLPKRNKEILRLHPAPVGKCSNSRALLAAGSICSTESASTGRAKMIPCLAAAVRHFPEPCSTKEKKKTLGVPLNHQKSSKIQLFVPTESANKKKSSPICAGPWVRNLTHTVEWPNLRPKWGWTKAKVHMSLETWWDFDMLNTDCLTICFQHGFKISREIPGAWEVGFEWKITALDSDLPLPLLKQE